MAHERLAQRQGLATREAGMLRQVAAERSAVAELLRRERPQPQAAFVVPDEGIGTAESSVGLTDALMEVPVLHRVEVLVESADRLEDAPPEEPGRLDRLVAEVAAPLEDLAACPESVAEALLRDDDGVHPPRRDLHACRGDVRLQDHVAVDEEQELSLRHGGTTVALRAALGPGPQDDVRPPGRELLASVRR